MRIYYCDCGEKVEILNQGTKECNCGYVFGSTAKISDGINVRKKWSGTTKIEFNETTVDESIRKMNNG